MGESFRRRQSYVKPSTAQGKIRHSLPDIRQVHTSPEEEEQPNTGRKK
eukprot:CAMPEP_0117433586 /NCGR_PEP_ID=MMETSP0758-20121206/12928_1 /TAXON_ID=63605 /ORGANISM="Percolomonas cosmopolitus, Strain AE-1 (ATCC 50343)" /LENGTH=47 /DNA_ID= /DNA_START= /DNA_END= /DNA_ORIENTATION=